MSRTDPDLVLGPRRAAGGDDPPADAPADAAPRAPGSGRLPALLRPLRNRNYAYLFTGQFCSLIGDQLYIVAIPFLILGRAGVAELGLVLMCFGVARIATLPVGGILADRMSRVRLMLLTDVGRAACVLAVAAVAFAPERSMLPVMALTAVLGALEGLFVPASYAILPEVLTEDELPAGNSLNTALESGASFVGPALAGLVVAGFSPGVALVVDAVTFVVSALTLLAIRLRGRGSVVATSAGEGDGEPEDRTVRGFLTLLGTNRVVQLVLLITLFSGLAFDGMTEVALPLLSIDYLADGARGFGLMLACFGAGAVVGSLVTDAFFRLRRRGLLALLLGVVQGLALLLVPLVGGLVGACALLAVAGATIGLLNTFYLTHLQQRVPTSLLGRTMGVLTMASFGAQPVSVLVAGLVLTRIGPAPIFATAGLLIVAGYLIALVSAEFRRL